MAADTACSESLYNFCNSAKSACEHGGTLVPRFDRSVQNSERAWRCYALESLDSEGRVYEAGSAYCTRHAALTALLVACKSTAAVDGLSAAPHRAATIPPPPPPPPPLPKWTSDADERVRTIAAVDTSAWQPARDRELLHVHAWEVPCIDKFADHKLNKYTGNVSRLGLSCFGRCVRGVVDGFATHAEAAALRTLAKAPTRESPGNINTWRWDVPDAPRAFRGLVARAQAVLSERFGAGPLRFYRSNLIVWDGAPMPTPATSPRARSTATPTPTRCSCTRRSSTSRSTATRCSAARRASPTRSTRPRAA